MHLKEIFDLTQGQGHMKHCPLNHVPYVPAKFEVGTPMVKEMHLQGNTLFDLDLQGHTKCCSVPFTSCDLCTSKV